MNKPLVSIFIITYNQRSFIREAVRSAVEQDYPNLEVVVADDCSTDGTADIILEYADKYPGRVVPVIGDKNLGITGNSNRGLRLCHGKYIAFQGGDDVLLPGKITHQVAWLEADPKRVLCYHDMDVFDSTTGKTLYLQSSKYKFYAGGANTLVSFGTYFGGTTAMIRYPHERKIYFDAAMPVSSDWLFWIDIVELQQGIVGYIDGVYARYRRHSNNITSNSNHGFRENLKTLEIVSEKYKEYQKLCDKRRSLIYLMEAKRLLLANKYYEAIKSVSLSARYCNFNFLLPFRLTNKKHRIPGYLGESIIWLKRLFVNFTHRR